MPLTESYNELMTRLLRQPMEIELSTELVYTQSIFIGEDWSQVTMTWAERLERFMMSDASKEPDFRNHKRIATHVSREEVI